jgi:hypothetical protein
MFMEYAIKKLSLWKGMVHMVQNVQMDCYITYLLALINCSDYVVSGERLLNSQECKVGKEQNLSS